MTVSAPTRCGQPGGALLDARVKNRPSEHMFLSTGDVYASESGNRASERIR